jgi:hypothetical protein
MFFCQAESVPSLFRQIAAVSYCEMQLLPRSVVQKKHGRFPYSRP